MQTYTYISEGNFGIVEKEKPYNSNLGGIKMDRFKKVYQQGVVDVIEIWVDMETGVKYVFHRNGNAAGFTPLLDKEGKPIVTP